MNIYTFELNNDIKGVVNRKQYIEQLITQAYKPDLIVLPELALCSYMGSDELWSYADDNSIDTSQWAMEIAEKYSSMIAVGYCEKRDGNYYNSYLIADRNKVYGIIRKSEGESYIFQRGKFSNIISTPIGNVAVGICYDSRRRHFYENVKNEMISLILFPHGSLGDPTKITEEQNVVDSLCNAYLNAFLTPVVYSNSKGKLDFMLGTTGKMMMKAGFTLNGLSKIYSDQGNMLSTGTPEIIGWSGDIKTMTLKQNIYFYKNDIAKGNWLFRTFILQPDIRRGIRYYQNHIKEPA